MTDAKSRAGQTAASLARAAPPLRVLVAAHARHVIDGAFVESADGETFATLNPASNEPITAVARGASEDVDRAVRAARRANSQYVRDLRTPFGGMKSSGIGREGGHYSFEFYMEYKAIHTALGTHRIPRMRTGGDQRPTDFRRA